MTRRILSLALLAATVGCSHSMTTVIVLRHAEKQLDQGDDPALTEKGTARAERLAEMLARTEPVALYATQWRRTKDTLQPLAEALHLPIEAVDAKQTDELAKKILAEHRGRTIVVAGHSNTVNRLIAALGGPTFADLADADYDNLFLLTICGSQAKLQTLRVEMGP